MTTLTTLRGRMWTRISTDFLPFADAATFEPFLYGDYLWATTTQFVEFHGMAALRPPRRVTASLSRPSEPSSRPPV